MQSIRRRLALVAVPLALALLPPPLAGTGSGVRPAGANPPAAAWRAAFDAGGRIRGVCWEGGGRIDTTALRPVRALGADWISQTPFGWSRGVDVPEVRLATDRVWWGESDSGLVQTAAWARQLGMRTLLAPHLWVRHGQWAGELAMHNEADWQQWFAAYEIFILHYARLAERYRLDGFAIGTELAGTTSRTADWRRLIAAVRREYHGPLTYCANWNQEVDAIAFWDDLDFIGVQAYYPLCDASRPSPQEIRAAWEPHRRSLARLAGRTHKPIVFTEVGYKSAAGALREPWAWDRGGEQDLLLQRDAYQAMFETFWTQPWFGGTFIWKWHANLTHGMGDAGRDFSPQGKPALDVIHGFYAARGGGTSP